jgi:NTP pyrophosphatase (non-canonical NTP hydrolase)
MDIKTLEAAMNAFVEGKGWYRPDSPHPQTPRSIAISLVIEASEALELFQWREQADKAALTSELADVMLYLLQLASLHDIDLGQAVMEKLKVNDGRHWED